MHQRIISNTHFIVLSIDLPQTQWLPCVHQTNKGVFLQAKATGSQSQVASSCPTELNELDERFRVSKAHGLSGQLQAATGPIAFFGFQLVVGEIRAVDPGHWQQYMIRETSNDSKHTDASSYNKNLFSYALQHSHQYKHTNPNKQDVSFYSQAHNLQVGQDIQTHFSGSNYKSKNGTVHGNGERNKFL
jgi:hypothetical protein